MEFIQPTESFKKIPRLPSVAMKFNGSYIEEKLEGYLTLNVSGREMATYDIQSERRSNGHGSIRYGKTMSSKLLTIQYRLRAETAEELQYKFDELKKLLYSKDIVPIEFADERGVTYYGEYETAETVPSDRLSVVSNFTIFCPEPFKYRHAIVTDGAVITNTFYPTAPHRMIITTDTTTNSIDITNGEQTIQLRGEINAGTVIEIDVDEQEVYADEVERMDLIDLHSDFENFTVQNGQTVTTNNGTLELHVREVL